MAGAGQRIDFTQQSYTLTDHLTATVNVGTGNLELDATDLVLPGVDGGLTLGRVFNSMAAAPGSSMWFSPLFGYTWRFDQAPDVRLTLNADGSIGYDTASGNVATFTPNGTGYNTPAGLDATLVENGNYSSYTLTFNLTGEVMTFGGDGNLLSDKDRNGNTVTFSYYQGRLVLSVTGDAGSAPGNTATITYGGPGGRVSSISQTDGTNTRSVSYTYDPSGVTLEKVQDADNGVTVYGYDANDNVTQVTGPAPLSAVTKFTYDSSHRVTEVDRVIPGSPDQITYYNYTTPGETQVSDGDGHPPTIYTVNSSGQVTGASDAKGNTTATTYTADAQVGTHQNGLTGMTRNTYGANGGESLTATEDAETATVSETYNNPSYPFLPDTGTDSMGNTSQLTYSGPGNLWQVKDLSGNITTYTYNADGTKATATEPNNGAANNATIYGYNTVHQLTSITPPTGNSLGGQSFSYDGFGRLRTSKSGAGVTTTYTYDNLDRLQSETFSDNSPSITNSYDADGNPYQVTNSGGTTTTVYNAANELTSNSPPGGPTLTYGYDPAGNLISAGGDGRPQPTTYHYDKVDEVDQMTEPNGNIDIFAYNADHQRTDTWDDTGTAVVYDGTGNNVIPPANFALHIHDTYNVADELTEIKTTRASSDATTVADLAYSYTVSTPSGCTGETAGWVTAMRQTSTDLGAGQTTIYCYNADGYLTSATTHGGSSYIYGYDADGNRTSDSNGAHTFNSADQLTDPGTTYDADGNLTASAADPAVTYNSIDQTTNANGTNLAYGTRSQDDRTVVGTTTQANGLLGVQVDTITASGVATYYERDPHGTLVSEITPGGNPADEFYYVFDGQGSVIGLVDATGTQRAVYSYDPYGAHATATAINGTPPANPWRYDGGYLDPSGLYHFGARYYDPITGRFTQLDPATTPSGGNRYAFAGDDPANNTDLTGHQFETLNLSDFGVGPGQGVAVFILLAPGADVYVAALGYDLLPLSGSGFLIGNPIGANNSAVCTDPSGCVAEINLYPTTEFGILTQLGIFSETPFTFLDVVPFDIIQGESSGPVEV